MRLVRGVGVAAGPAHRGHPSRGEPLGRGIEQSSRDRVVIACVKEAEEADLGVVVIIESAIDGRSDTPEKTMSITSKKMRHFGLAVIGMLRREQPRHAEQTASEKLGTKRRRPVRISAEQHPGNVDELAQVAVPQLDPIDSKTHGVLSEVR